MSADAETYTIKRFVACLIAAAMLYMTPLLVSAWYLFGHFGIIFAGFIFCIWSYYYSNRLSQFVLRNTSWLVIAGLIGCTPIFWKMESIEHDKHLQEVCSNKLKQIGLALQQYHQTYQSYPPAYIADSQGRPMHSWRVLLLPFLGHQKLYDLYDFTEPWNSPHNSQILEHGDDIYTCPKHCAADRTDTSYLAIIGEDTAWPGLQAVQVRDFTDGTSNTIQLIESHKEHISWTEPRDLDFQQTVKYLAISQSAQQFPHLNHEKNNRFYHAMLASIDVRQIGDGIDANIYRQLLDRHDAEVLACLDEHGSGLAYRGIRFNDTTPANQKLNLSRDVQLLIFVLLAFAPLAGLWLLPVKQADQQLIESA